MTFFFRRRKRAGINQDVLHLAEHVETCWGHQFDRVGVHIEGGGLWTELFCISKGKRMATDGDVARGSFSILGVPGGGRIPTMTHPSS